MLNTLVRPVQKQVPRLFLAGTNNAVGANAVSDGHDHDVAFAPVAPTPPTQAVEVEQTHSHSHSAQLGFNRAVIAQPCLWQQPSYQWPPWQEHAAASGGNQCPQAAQVNPSPGTDGEAYGGHEAYPSVAATDQVLAGGDGSSSFSFTGPLMTAIPVLPGMHVLNGGWPYSTAMLPVLMPVEYCTASPAVCDASISGSGRPQRPKQVDTVFEQADSVKEAVLSEDLQTEETLSDGQFWPSTPESTPPSSPREELLGFVNPAQYGGQPAQGTLQSGPCWSSAWALALTQSGSRLVQQALEEADHRERVVLANQLRGHVQEATTSPHANHFLQKCIEVMPPEKLNFIFEEMQGHAVTIAKHRYGCRVLERLMEHCPARQTVGLIEEVLVAASQLCRHVFGNFVIQHIFEHGTLEHKKRLSDVIVSDLRRLSRHRVASHVVRAALVHCPSDEKMRIAQALTAEASELADLTRHHWGSFVVRELRHQFHGQVGVGVCNLNSETSANPSD